MLKCETPVRHGWAWLEASWTSLLRSPIDASARQLIEDWRCLNLPFVVAAAGEGIRAGAVRLGLATPDKRRFGFYLERAALGRIAPPPTLREAMAAASVHWRARLNALDAAARKVRIELSVYGSLAWSLRSGISFVHAHSDVDLLLDPRGSTLSQLYAFLDTLVENDGIPRLDGEVVLNEAAVAWRELARRPESLLVKRSSGPCLRGRSWVEASFRQVCA